MADTAYANECLRAELLGIQPPDRDTFISTYHEPDEEQVEIETAKAEDEASATTDRISGGLDELNAILQVTQRKINTFKASCGSLTSLVKSKLGYQTIQTTSASGEDGSSQVAPPVPNNDGNHLDRLDAMIEKAEHAQYSMKSQTNQMKRFLN